eukprot:CAMPEP_0118941364 /NCGR_PEP_ID=MMETSP1169-20130426/33679_1 /TAXON_ID=36882 /ORGANISM="Pyramimonas obovata, Strain CCMP722" /LENGTH=49 /DNA_ID= /DNA_START= /DNA_END= /DNA_ORIENTATION=
MSKHSAMSKRMGVGNEDQGGGRDTSSSEQRNQGENVDNSDLLLRLRDLT